MNRLAYRAARAAYRRAIHLDRQDNAAGYADANCQWRDRRMVFWPTSHHEQAVVATLPAEIVRAIRAKSNLQNHRGRDIPCRLPMGPKAAAIYNRDRLPMYKRVAIRKAIAQIALADAARVAA